MSDWSFNTLAVARPSPGEFKTMSCSASCVELGPVDPLNRHSLGPRPKREQIREQIRDAVLLMLGAPVIKIELDQQQVDFAIDMSLKILETYAPREYFSYHTFTTRPGQSVYEMPPDIGYVREVIYKETPQNVFGAQDLGGSIPIEYFAGTQVGWQGAAFSPTVPVWGAAGEWTLFRQYETMYSRIGSQIGGWEWVGGYRHIKLFPAPMRAHPVAVHYIQKNKDWDDVSEMMIEGALTYAKEMLGRIRSKYATPPGAGGGAGLDGQALLAEAKEERAEWKQRLLDYWGGGSLGISMG